MSKMEAEKQERVAAANDMETLEWTITGGFCDQSKGPTKVERIHAAFERTAINFFRNLHPDLPIVQIKSDRPSYKLRAWAEEVAGDIKRMKSIDEDISELQDKKLNIDDECERNVKAIVEEIRRTMPETWQDEIGELLENAGVGQLAIWNYFPESVTRAYESRASKR